MRAGKLEDYGSLGAALSLLASLKSGRVGSPRARKQRDSDATGGDAPESASQRHSPRDERGARYWRWLDHAIVGLWIATLISIIGYALVEGENVMAQLDGLDLVATYSLLP